MRELDLDEFVDEIYEDIQKNSDSKYIFFLGAGCSVLIEIEFITNAQAMANYDSKKEILAKGIAEIAQRFDDLVK